MNNYDFVSYINTKVRESVVNIVENDLNNSIDNDLLRSLSEWYCEKDSIEKEIIKKFIYRVFDCSAWRILYILDNGRLFDGEFELVFKDKVTDQTISLIDPPHLDDLHDLYVPIFRENNDLIKK